MSSGTPVACPASVGGGGDLQQAPSASSTTTSTIVVTDSVEGTHVLTIDGYSRGNKHGHAIPLKSSLFRVGGHAWFISYYLAVDENKTDWISLYLTLAHTNINVGEVKIHLRFSLLDHAGEPAPSHTMAWDFTLWEFDSAGCPWFMEKKVLDESPCLLDGSCFRVRCDISVKSHGSKEAVSSAQLIAVPPPDMHRHVGDLLASQEGVDVTFEVNGETFGAHRLVLAARSPLFKARFFGAMKEESMSRVQIKDMDAAVFRAMLHFIYNDTLPPIDSVDMPAMAWQLLVAAELYGLGRLKLICEDKLWYSISTSTVATTLANAEKHGCLGLKEACLEFLKMPRNLKAVMATDDYQYLMRNFPSLLTELLAKLAL